MELTTEQKDIVSAVLNDIKKGISPSVGGLAGTGKSTIAKYLKAKLPKFAVCAFTGKAADVLRKKGMDKASTIHSLIYEFEPLSMSFHLKDDVSCDGFLVDEASMLSGDLYADLKSFGKPIILIGDHGQLEPVGDNPNLMADPMYKLETIHRYAGELAHFAQWVRQGRPPAAFRGTGAVQIARSWELTPGKLAEANQVICRYNKTRVATNEKIRTHLGHTGKVRPGERVMCLRNNKELGLFNGMQGTVAAIHTKFRMDFRTDDGEVFHNVEYEPAVFGQEKINMMDVDKGTNPFDFAYCATCHKCVHPDTIVETPKGLVRIEEIGDAGEIATSTGPSGYCNKVRNPVGPMLKFVCEDGYSITVTPDHRMETWDGEKYVLIEASLVRPGQFFRVRLGETIPVTRFVELPTPISGDVREMVYSTPAVVDEDVAEFLGLMVADGCLFDTGFRLVKRHQDVADRFAHLCCKLFGRPAKSVKVKNAYGFEVSSTYLRRWLASIGGLTAEKKAVPDCILRSPIGVQAKFLRGLFEDGGVKMNDEEVDYVYLSSSYPRMIEVVKIMLARMGIVSGSIETRPTTLPIYGKYCKVFADKIGFVSSSKRSRLCKCRTSESRYLVPISREEVNWVAEVADMGDSDRGNARTRGYMSRDKFAKYVPQDSPMADRLNFHHVRVVRIEQTQNESLCVTVPATGTFLQNGFSHGNCQGSEWDTVMVIEQRSPYDEHARWAYTAATRAKERIVWAPAPPPRQPDQDDWF